MTSKHEGTKQARGELSEDQFEEAAEKTVQLLQDSGPLSHDEITSKLEFDDEFVTQKLIHGLRNEGKVAITLDRRYSLEEDE
ncbi:hypothetical protein [Salinigranum rubrum]|uniref:hypothetical protein n=1 Tax=Salinigranum rubrum TaxID=755307 RepID=UPI0013A5AD2B|nr:hypothetical protein [Salinigranum rubrum]